MGSAAGTGAAAADALAASSHAAHAEAYNWCVLPAACLQPAAATIRWIEQAMPERAHLADHPDLVQTLAALRDDPAGPGLDFPRFF